MRKQILITLAVCLMGAAAASAQQKQQIRTVEFKPLEQVLTGKPQPVKLEGDTLQLGLITWGAETAPIEAELAGIFTDEGLKVKLFLENDFAKQCELVFAGTTPLLRGTLGMINEAAPAFEKAKIPLEVFVLYSASIGGDCAVGGPDLKNLRDLKPGWTCGLQLHGPHMDYAPRLLADAGIPLESGKFVWFKELSLPTYDTGGLVIDDVDAWRADPKMMNFIMCISPDAMTLTSRGKVGTGSDQSVLGAHILVRTDVARRVIFDVVAVRKDWGDANRTKLQALTHALLRAQEHTQDLFDNKATKQSEYQQLLSKSADLLFGSPTATKDVEDAFADCELMFHGGNVAFFTGKGTDRNFKVLTDEIQASFIKMGLISKPVALQCANWDWAALAKGLKRTEVALPAAPKVDQKAVAAKVEKDMAEQDFEAGNLFDMEIRFDTMQTTFPIDKYTKEFKEGSRLIQTYSGATLIFEGNVDPYGINKAKEEGKPAADIAVLEQKAKNLSLQRAAQAKADFLEYCKQANVPLNEDQFTFVVTGRGIGAPTYPNPVSKDQQKANRRVRFIIRSEDIEVDIPEK